MKISSQARLCQEWNELMTARTQTYIAVVFLLMWFSPVLLAQEGPAGILRGQVTDPSGAAITKATVVLTPAAGSPLTTQTDNQGMFVFKGLAPGKYTLYVAAEGFTPYKNSQIEFTGNQALRLNVPMNIAVQEQELQVSDTAPTLDVNPASNAGAIVISGEELEALPDDPDELQSDLEALAGPSAGPNGGQMYIDGFTAGQLPPKSSIREIRINQNPFSSEYDKLGYGRIEIFTKPGTDKFHGQLFVDGNTSVFNSPNPFAGPEPGYDSTQYSGNVGGPISKTASFFFNAERRNINDLSAVNAITLDPSDPTATIPFAEAVPNPRQRTNISPRLDYAISKNNTLTARYQYFRDTQTNDGVGAFNLASQGYNSDSTEHTVQVSDTQVFGAKIVNETRFQYLRENDSQAPVSAASVVTVLGAFTEGGNSQGTQVDHQDHYELQNYTSLIHGNHILKFGGRLRLLRDHNSSTSGFNGTFIFSSLESAQDTPANCPSLGGTTPCPISYQYAVQQLQGGPPFATTLATQLSVTTGIPAASVSTYDGGLYVQDDWRVRPNVTLSYGLRLEMQNDIHDHGDWAPRLGFAWGIGGRSSPPIVVLRGGFGIFYDRFLGEQILQAERLNGVTQQQYVVSNPMCFPGLGQPLVISSCDLSSASSTNVVYQISPRLHAPGTIQSAIGVERQLTKATTLSVTYLNSRGFDQLLSINSNAPIPATSIRPDPSKGNIYEYVSEGVFRQNQLIVNSNMRLSSKLQLFGYYTLNYANSDASGVSSFPSNSYNISADYGRASFDTRHRLFLGGTIALPRAFRLSPFMIASSGSPFNLTLPNDLNGDSIFNDRPGFFSTATCATTTVSPTNPNRYCTSLGTFDAIPVAGERIVPINYGTGPAHFVLNLRLTKTIGFGPKARDAGNQGSGGRGRPGGGGRRGPLFGGGPVGMSANSDRRYNLILGVSARNALNKVNLANPSGILGSPFFDTSNALQGGPFSTSSANRRIDLQITFSF
jgi:Carboxypeptidase regulatory-like domain